MKYRIIYTNHHYHQYMLVKSCRGIYRVVGFHLLLLRFHSLKYCIMPVYNSITNIISIFFLLRGVCLFYFKVGVCCMSITSLGPKKFKTLRLLNYISFQVTLLRN